MTAWIHRWHDWIVADVKANGLLDPIILWRGQIVDGKHRYRACAETGTAPRFDTLPDEWDEWKVAVHCQSKHRRRNLSATQKACVAAEVIEKYGRSVGRPAKTEEAEELPPRGGNSDKGTAAAAAARDMGSSERSVERALTVRKNAPEVYELAKQDKIPITDIVTRAISGHATPEMQRHYSTVRDDEIRAGLAKVIDIATGRERTAA